MSRDGSGVYTIPAGTHGIPDTTISSTKYNAFVDDIAQDQNTPRPIVAGGTGAINPDAALLALGGEKAKQIVTNWDGTPWIPGSFYATTAATGISPIGTVPPTTPHAFAGIAYYATATDFVVEALDLTTGIKYIRYMTSGVWGPWGGENSTLFVLKAGDTMTGSLNASAPNNSFGPGGAANVQTVLQVNGSSHASALTYMSWLKGGTERWQLGMDVTGSDSFNLFTNAGGVLSFSFNATTGLGLLSADPAQPLGIATKQYVDARAVRNDAAQGLTAAQQAQARQNIAAAPFDALAYNGMQVNGSHNVNQAGVSSISANGYITDSWSFYKGGSMTAAALNDSGMFVGYPNHLTIAVSLGSGIAAGDFLMLQTSIEGYRTARLDWGHGTAQPMTLAFWTAHHRAGIYTGTLRNGATNRSYAFSYQHTTPDTPQFQIITITGDVAGAWDYTSGLGLAVTFAVAMGTTYIAPSLNNWVAGNFLAGPGQINGAADSADRFRIGGVLMLPGLEAPPPSRAPLLTRPGGQELEICRRYWQALYAGIDFYASAGAGGIGTQGITFSPQMRVGPTITYSTLATSNASAVASYNVTYAGVFPQVNNLAIGRCYWYGSVLADARL